ncbi:MAG: hypothetical protein LBC20_00025 [Planctomycetaceae bacterium]|nr:hypothetical protein [Planctomycetaceae bacterium]
MVQSQEIKSASQILIGYTQFPEGVLTLELTDFLDQSGQIGKQYTLKGVDVLLQDRIFAVDNNANNDNDIKTAQNYLLTMVFEKHKTKVENNPDNTAAAKTHLASIALRRNPKESLSGSDAGIELGFSPEGTLGSFTLHKVGTSPPFSFFVKYYKPDKIERIIVTHFDKFYCRNIHWDENGRIIKDMIDPFLGSPLWEKQEEERLQKKLEQKEQKEKGVL